MPDDAAEAFQRLKRILCSSPILTMPDGKKQYVLIVDASTGAQDFEGGLGAIRYQQSLRRHRLCVTTTLQGREAVLPVPFGNAGHGLGYLLFPKPSARTTVHPLH